MDVLYERIRERREELGMTQEELAVKIGYKSRSSINKIELGLNDLPHSKIIEFANALRTTPEYLMAIEEDDEEAKVRELFKKIRISMGIDLDNIEELTFGLFPNRYINDFERGVIEYNLHEVMEICEVFGINIIKLHNDAARLAHEAITFEELYKQNVAEYERKYNKELNNFHDIYTVPSDPVIKVETFIEQNNRLNDTERNNLIIAFREILNRMTIEDMSDLLKYAQFLINNEKEE